MNCKNCKNWVFGRCVVSNLVVGPGQLCNAWELSQSHEMVTMPFATFDDKELQERIAELEAANDVMAGACETLRKKIGQLTEQIGITDYPDVEVMEYKARIAELEAEKSILEDQLREANNYLVDKKLHIDSLYEEGYKLQQRIAELEGFVDEFITASSNVLNPYDGISVPYGALKKLVQRARKKREIPCKHCHGTGTVYLEGSIHGEDICPKCHGTGIKEREE